MRFATIFGGSADQKSGRSSALAHKTKAKKPGVGLSGGLPAWKQAGMAYAQKEEKKDV